VTGTSALGKAALSVLLAVSCSAAIIATAPRGVESKNLMPMGPPGAVDLTVYRTEADSSVTYHYLLHNHAGEDVHNFFIGMTMSSDSCPDLQRAPVGFDAEKNRCPNSIVIRKPWTGCVNGQEECYGGFLEFDYPDAHAFDGLAPGDSLVFSVTLSTADSTYEHPGFWISGNSYDYEGRARSVLAPKIVNVQSMPHFGDWGQARMPDSSGARVKGAKP